MELTKMIDLLGKKVIVRSNEDEPYKVGVFAELEPRWGGTSKSLISHIPRITLENGEDIHTLGVIIPYTEEIAKLLDGLTSKRQWEILSGISLAIQEVRCRR